MRYVKKTRRVIFLLCLMMKVMVGSANQQGSIKSIEYRPKKVVNVCVAPLSETQIVLLPHETIDSIHSGDIASWTVVVSKVHRNMFFIKPTVNSSHTDMTVVTNRHTYYFRLSTCADASADSAVYGVHFYSNTTQPKLAYDLSTRQGVSVGITPLLRFSHHFNWQYTYSGERSIMPRHVFDDGRFTYFLLQPQQPVPAIFAVMNASGLEHLVNYRKWRNFLIVQRLAPQFTLREGPNAVVSIFNQGLIHAQQATSSYAR